MKTTISNTSTSITPASTTGASGTVLEFLVLLVCGVTIPWGGGSGTWRLHTYYIYSIYSIYNVYFKFFFRLNIFVYTDMRTP